jgi:hypothetical protein
MPSIWLRSTSRELLLNTVAALQHGANDAERKFWWPKLIAIDYRVSAMRFAIRQR